MWKHARLIIWNFWKERINHLFQWNTPKKYMAVNQIAQNLYEYIMEKYWREEDEIVNQVEKVIREAWSIDLFGLNIVVSSKDLQTEDVSKCQPPILNFPGIIFHGFSRGNPSLVGICGIIKGSLGNTIMAYATNRMLI